MSIHKHLKKEGNEGLGVCVGMIKKIVAVVLILLLCGQAVAFSATNVKEAQEKQSQIENENKKLQEEIEKKNKQVSEKENKHTELLLELESINVQISTSRSNLLQLENQIAEKKQSIEETNKQIARKKEKLMERIKVLYMAGEASNLEIILGAKDFSDLLDKLDLVQWISERDYKLITDFRNDIEKVKAKKQVLEDTKKTLESEQLILDENQEKYEVLVKENQKELNVLNTENQTAVGHLEENNEELKKIEKEIEEYYIKQKEKEKKEKERLKKEQQRKEQEEKEAQKKKETQEKETQEKTPNNGGNSSSNGNNQGSSQTGGGNYLWPVPGFYHLTSLWGEDRGYSNHGALDIAQSGISGAKVLAAQSGVVVLSYNGCIHNWAKEMNSSCGCGGGYGNYVMIDHGDGKSTLYAHFSSVAVFSGQSVSKGQVIGYVGTTGHSTGSHLHFETRKYNQKYNPLTEYPDLRYTY